jgi:hypothetical protein
MAATPLLTACTSDSGDVALSDVTLRPGAVEGVVVAVDGTLAEIASFRLVLADGTEATFVPEQGVLFDGTAPLSHLRDHLASGDPIRVEYATLEDGTLLALEVGDG